MSANVLLSLLNKFWKRDKMRGLPSILSRFRNEFNIFNNTRARSLISDVKTLLFCHYVRNVVMDVITFPEKL